MIDIKQMEQKAQALLNEVRAEYSLISSEVASNLALCRAIEQHEAFRQEVSDAVEAVFAGYHDAPIPWVVMRRKLEPFIIAKPDPLVEAITEADLRQEMDVGQEEYAVYLRAAIEKRGGKITWGEG